MWISIQLTRSRRLGNWTRPRVWSSSRWKILNVVVPGRVWAFCHRQGVGVFLYSVHVSGERYKQWDWMEGVEDCAMLRRPTPTPEGEKKDHLAPVESKLLAKHASLLAHCAATRYTDGGERKTGQILIQVQGENWVVELRDKDTARRIRVVASTFDAAINQANVLAGEPDAPWEHAEWLLDDAPKKKKK